MCVDYAPKGHQDKIARLSKQLIVMPNPNDPPMKDMEEGKMDMSDAEFQKLKAAEKKKDPYAKRGYGGKDVVYDYDKYGATDDMYGTRRPWEK